MPYILHGNLWGYICRECPRPLWGVIVRVYEPDDANLIERVAADPRFTAASLDEKTVKARHGRLLAEATVSEDGSYEISFDERSNYRGGPVEVDLRMEGLPNLDQRTSGMAPRQIQLTTLQPAWREREKDRIAYWEHYVPARTWCRILSWYDIWVICGRVTICDTDRPLAGVIVEARDVDWTQQDYLGAATTDGTGRFVIYYPGSAFRRGSWMDIELIGGPDIYFTIKTPAGLILVQEPPARGRQADRENVDHCFCVHDLCVPASEVPPREGRAVFTRVGHYIYADQIDSGLGGSGLTKGDGLAFIGTLRLNGQLPQTLGGQPVEYCFEWRELDSHGNEISPWKRVTPAQIAPTDIGTLTHYDPTNFINHWPTKACVVNGTDGPNEKRIDFTADGWIPVPQESNWVSGNFAPSNDLIRLNSAALVNFGSFDMSGITAGSSAAPLGANRYFGLRMLARAGGVNQVEEPGTLNQIAINNKLYDNIVQHPYWNKVIMGPGQVAVNMLGIEELVDAGCKKIEDKFTPLVTAAHPSLGSVTLELTGGNAQDIVPGGAVITAPAAGLPGERFGKATLNFDPKKLKPCAYILTLTTTVLLTNGDVGPSIPEDEIAFAKA